MCTSTDGMWLALDIVLYVHTQCRWSRVCTGRLTAVRKQGLELACKSRQCLDSSDNCILYTSTMLVASYGPSRYHKSSNLEFLLC